MGNSIGIQISVDGQNEGRLVPRNKSAGAKSATRLWILDWYRILRAHHQWTMFQAIRYALWFTR
jgi:hypothetical protein